MLRAEFPVQMNATVYNSRQRTFEGTLMIVVEPALYLVDGDRSNWLRHKDDHSTRAAIETYPLLFAENNAWSLEIGKHRHHSLTFTHYG